MSRHLLFETVAPPLRSPAALPRSLPLASLAARTRPALRFFTPGVAALTALALLGWGALLYRFLFGLGASTHLSDARPWGLWIAIDVAGGVALAAGGFMTAFLVRVVHRRDFQPLVRPALLTALLGYTFVGLGVMSDLGRYWAIWHVLMPSMWQPNSVLFEVAVCVVTYLAVLYVEFLPAVCERFRGRLRSRPLAALLRGLEASLGRIMLAVIFLGVVLSCMHQSSLGSLMVIAGDKLHPLWQTPVLPLLFLLSALAVGYPMVIFESVLAARAFRVEPERRLLSRLARFVPVILGLYFAAKVIDVVNRGATAYLAELSWPSVLFLAELGLGIALPFAIFISPRLRRSTPWLFTASLLVILGVVLNRVDVFIVGYEPAAAAATYVPAWTEFAVTAGFIASIALLYRLVAFHFPVLAQLRHAAA